MRVRFSDASLGDLDNIFDHIAAGSLTEAVRMLVWLAAAADGLAGFPNIGRPGVLSGTRELVTVRPYVIVYRIATGS